MQLTIIKTFASFPTAQLQQIAVILQQPLSHHNFIALFFVCALQPFKLLFAICTCTEIKDNITEKYCIRYNIEDDTTKGEIIIEEGNSNRENYEISNKKKEHTNVPVEPSNENVINFNIRTPTYKVFYSNIDNGFY